MRTALQRYSRAFGLVPGALPSSANIHTALASIDVLGGASSGVFGMSKAEWKEDTYESDSSAQLESKVLMRIASSSHMSGQYHHLCSLRCFNERYSDPFGCLTSVSSLPTVYTGKSWLVVEGGFQVQKAAEVKNCAWIWINY
jgi:hypothetical protein